ncbi:hypothetical protein GMOD_00004949 [Pyrenophora seminiperda CCB06]|uniref:Uncharacterized protein n=1 Tax=Pyrenophora seminiperda CCB06 TaxID=1302712 RepID=A0A3M7MHS7_9PLEO|nr:hypothetical protein GMOD_00004949 [Pyrenophora seminiperda CCB06]
MLNKKKPCYISFQEIKIDKTCTSTFCIDTFETLLPPAPYKDVKEHSRSGIIKTAHALEISVHLFRSDTVKAYIVSLEDEAEMVKILPKNIERFKDGEKVKKEGEKALESFKDWFKTTRECRVNSTRAIRYMFYHPCYTPCENPIFENHEEPKRGIQC